MLTQGYLKDGILNISLCIYWQVDKVMLTFTIIQYELSYVNYLM